MGQQDQKYILAIQHNDTRGLQAIYQVFYPRIQRFIQQNGGSLADAQDIFQEALVIIFKKIKSGNFTLSSGFYTLLYGICRNLWGNQLQKKSRTEVTLLSDYKYTIEPGFESLIEAAEEQQIFWDAFKKLSTDCQQILQLFFAKVKMAKIVEEMQLSSVAYAKKRKFQCKEKLVDFVKADTRYLELTQN